MADILNVGTSALLALQRAITTTGHNIANVNTDGYSRQAVNFDTLPPQLSGGSYIGSGVTIDSVQRIYNEYLASEVRDRSSSQAGFEAYANLTSRMDSLLADPSTGLSPALDDFFSALQDVANSPGALPERQVLLGQAQVLAERFNYLDSNFRDIGGQVNAQILSSVQDINSLASNIAELNEQIVRATATAGGQPPNDLLDSRDLMINQLSERIGVSTTKQADGSVNVMVGNGQALVVGFSANQLETFTDPRDSSRTVVGVGGVNGLTDIGRFLSGGELGAVLDFRDQVLEPALSQLGLVATGVSATFNAQHMLGQDLDGNTGSAFFQPLAPVTSAAPANTGTAAVTVDITDATALTGDDYSLRYDGSQYVLTNLSSNTVLGTGTGPFTVEGLTITPGGTPDSGDAFLIQPTSQAASVFAVALSQPEQIAAAAPLRAQTLLSNTGTAALAGPTATDATLLPLGSQVSLSFNPDALGPGQPGFDVSGIAGGPLAYDPALEGNGKDFALAGFSFSISGTPDTGDAFVIENNTGASGDNRNALALADLQDARQLQNGSASYQDVYGQLVADIGVKTRQAQSSASAEQVMLDQAISARDSVSGVNLDEEAADLIRFQQAYQAAAQVIAVADEIFQTLLNATRR